VVITVLMYPPGPGSPLPDRVPSRWPLTSSA